MNLMGKPPLGQKAPKPEAVKKRRKGIARRSKKRLAYLASEERRLGVAHMEQVAQLPCLVCDAWSVEVHHPEPRSDLEVLPLCPPHHRREYGPGAFHYSPSQFYERHGDRAFLLAVVADKLAGEFNE